MKKLTFLFLMLFLFSVNRAQKTEVGTPVVDSIKAAALNYIEGWYEGNPERMEKALHPELAKRMVYTDQKSGKSRLHQMGAMTLVQRVKEVGENNTPLEKQLKEVTILDIFQNTACVKIVASDWIDYLQLVKWNGEWKIINVLWEYKKQ